jgi:hypothetical protein
VVALADGFRRPFARYWLSGFLADFGDGIRLAAFPLLAAPMLAGAIPIAGVISLLAWRHRRRGAALGPGA